MSGFTISGGAGGPFEAGGIEAFGELVLDRMVVSREHRQRRRRMAAVGAMALRDVTAIRNSLVQRQQRHRGAAPEAAPERS